MSKERLLEALKRGPAETKTLVRSLKLNRESAFKSLLRLEEKGLVIRHLSKVYWEIAP